MAIVDIASMEIESIVPIPHKDWSLYPQVLLLCAACNQRRTSSDRILSANPGEKGILSTLAS